MEQAEATTAQTEAMMDSLDQLENFDSGRYVWSLEGRLIQIKWTLRPLIGDISFAGLSELRSLQVSQGSAGQPWGLTSLDVSKNKNLLKLECGANKLTSLDVSKNKKLRSLMCGDNLIEKLVLNDDLIELSCANNKLTSLNLSKNLKLRRLTCSQLTSFL